MLSVQFSSNDTWNQPFRSFEFLIRLLPSAVAGLLIALALSVANGASLNVDQGFSVLHSFTISEGYSIGVPLIDGSTCYGSASWGGAGGVGSIYRVNTDGSDFDVIFSGSKPNASHPRVSAISDSTFFGTWSDGGNGIPGAVFRIQTDGTVYTALHNFTGPDGYYASSVVRDESMLYGTASSGGDYGNGVIFKMNMDGTGFTLLHSFDVSDGQWPGEVTLSGSTIYGGTMKGGANNRGVLYSYAIAPEPSPVTIDIKPGSDPNSINLGSNGNIPVVIFRADDFDATTIDPATILLADAGVQTRGKDGDLKFSFKDVNGDGIDDLFIHIDTEGLVLSAEDIEAQLTAETFDGLSIFGTDTIRLVGSSRGDFDMDGIVDVSDLGELAAYYGTITA
ncbi:MAG: hypothetical protein JXM70_20135 [Pirellulales bacterium]|nr:hypothetical protein [Pirellulales bacterium]